MCVREGLGQNYKKERERGNSLLVSVRSLYLDQGRYRRLKYLSVGKSNFVIVRVHAWLERRPFTNWMLESWGMLDNGSGSEMLACKERGGGRQLV